MSPRAERERTPEEREREREERARRRALREGRPDPGPPRPLPQAAEPEPEHAEPEAIEPEAIDAPEPLPAEEPAPPPVVLPFEPPTAPEPPAPEPEPEPLPPAAAAAVPAAAQSPEHTEEPDAVTPSVSEPAPDPYAEYEWPERETGEPAEPPPAVGIDAGLAVGDGASEEQPAPQAAPRAPRAPGGAPAARRARSPVTPRRGRGIAARLFAVAALLAAVVAIVLVGKSLKGSSTTKTVAAPVTVTVVIPEGKTRAQIAVLAQKDGLKGSYRLASRHSSLLNPVHYGAPANTPDLEGFLFPATYELYAHAPAAHLVEEQLAAFQENFGATEIARAKALGETPYQLLTVASLIEREAVLPGDRAKIAAVIYNRIKEGMPIGIDASIYYAVELRDNIATFTGELTEADLHMNSPYNTRIHTGLPPTPISNPGDASIHAAAYPANAPYLYYVAGADGCGEQVFSTTQAAFEEHVAAYEAAVKANGGKPPTCKKK